MATKSRGIRCPRVLCIPRLPPPPVVPASHAAETRATLTPLARLDAWLDADKSRQAIIERDSRRGCSYWQVWLCGSGREVFLTEVELMTSLGRVGLEAVVGAAIAEAERRGL